jgi:hypothetical protein
MELIQQLNEVVKDKDGIERPKLHRVIKNLITQATTAADEYDEDGNLARTQEALDHCELGVAVSAAPDHSRRRHSAD